jgi:hypothetical protein
MIIYMHVTDSIYIYHSVTTNVQMYVPTKSSNGIVLNFGGVDRIVHAEANGSAKYWCP